jgi:DNA-binding transcriptional LysR family regulator
MVFMSLLPKKLRHGRLDELAVLVDVAEAGSLTATAARLGVPKSTVGRAIRRIEEDVGVSLVRRMARGAVLTEPGQMLAELAAPHVAALRDATAALGRTSSEAYGVLRVTAPADVGAVVLGPLMPGFLARYPRVRPEIVHTLRVVDLVREGVDVAIRLSLNNRLPSSTLIAKRLGAGDVGFYASMSYAARRELPKHAQDLPDHDHVLLFPGDRSTYHLKGPKGAVTVRVPGRVSGDDFLFVRGAIVAGIGIGALPWFIARQELAQGTITPVLPEYRLVGGSAWVVYAPAKPVPPKVMAFCSYLLEHGPRIFTQP